MQLTSTLFTLATIADVVSAKGWWIMFVYDGKCLNGSKVYGCNGEGGTGWVDLTGTTGTGNNFFCFNNNTEAYILIFPTTDCPANKRTVKVTQGDSKIQVSGQIGSHFITDIGSWIAEQISINQGMNGIVPSGNMGVSRQIIPLSYGNGCSTAS